jgi:phosphoribosylaminoimidazolecarboxamide formyltransferase / IMP cyclohydrolase
MLTQIRDFVHDRELDNVRVVTLLKPDDEERKQLLFAWKAVFGVRSNGIVLCQDYSLIGMGAGQPSRVDAVRLAIQKAGKRINDSTVLASDGFFSFPDAIELASKAGIRCVIQPGGSRRDQEIIETANALGMVMLFTGIRHFKH